MFDHPTAYRPRVEDETLRAAWQRHAEQWIAWARTPGHDHHYWRLNLPAFLDLLPPPGRLTIERDGLAMTFTSVHRCLQTYWRALEAAGLVVDALREPRPDAAFVAAEPQAERWQRVPLFLHLRAVRKPARPESATARSGPPRTRDGRRPGAAARRR